MSTRDLLCRLGFHSTFIQHDAWGEARVCRYCVFADPVAPDPRGEER